MYIEHYGKMTIKNHSNGEFCEVEFKRRGWGGRGAFEVDGFTYNAKKEKKYRIWGKWVESLDIKNLESGKEERIWTSNPLPPESNRMYHFTYFTL